MRVAATVTALSWIPSESISGLMAQSFALKVTHYDEPPPDSLPDSEAVRRLRDDDRYRFANVLAAWADVEDGHVVGAGYDPASRLLMGSTTLGLGKRGLTYQGYPLPVLQSAPQLEPDRVRFLQTAGGRTGVPLPRPVPHPPFVQWQAPIVWTTLALTLHADGRVDVELPGASAFPRHWVYGPDGALARKSGLTDQASWVAHSFGTRTPWAVDQRVEQGGEQGGDQAGAVLVTAVESELERQMSRDLMRAGRRPDVRRIEAGATLVRQGDPGDELFLLLDGVLSVEIDGTQVAEVGPGAVLGERAVLEGGSRTATLVARTAVRFAAAASDSIDRDRLQALARMHRREDSSLAPEGSP